MTFTETRAPGEVRPASVQLLRVRVGAVHHLPRPADESDQHWKRGAAGPRGRDASPGSAYIRDQARPEDNIPGASRDAAPASRPWPPLRPASWQAR